MPRQCTVCAHPQKEGIDAALVRGVSPYQLEASHTELTRASIERHLRNGHVSNSLLKAQEVAEVARADTLLEQVRGYQACVDRLTDKAEEEGDLRTALSGLREARGYLELLAKLVGELDDRPQVNVLIDARVQQAIVEALEPYDAAKYAVSRALKELEDAGVA